MLSGVANDEQRTAFNAFRSRPLSHDEFGQGEVGVEMKRFDIAEMFVHVSREVWRIARHRDLTISFDYRGPSPLILGDHAGAYLSLRRLLSGAAQMVDAGCLEFDGEARLKSTGAVELCTKAVGCGTLASEACVREVLSQLLLDPRPFAAVDPVSTPRLRRATGRCPVSGMEIELGMIPSVGFILNSRWRWPAGQVVGFNAMRGTASPARAWVIDENPTSGATMVRRLRRSNWTAVHFASCADAERQLRCATTSQDEWPELVLLLEPRGRSLQGRDTLLTRLPVGTRCISIVEPGAEPAEAAAEVRVQPLSPKDLEHLAQT